MIRFALILPFILLLSTIAAAERSTLPPPIKQIKDAQPNAEIFKAATRDKPLVVRSVEEAAKHFGDKALAALKKHVDFEKQILLVFAWRGSGQDKLEFDVLESFPEQVVFNYKRGRTKDLRPHVYVYALRSNVKWRTK